MSSSGFGSDIRSTLRSIQDQIDQGQISQALDQLQELEQLELSTQEAWETEITKAAVLLELKEISQTEHLVKELSRNELDTAQELAVKGMTARVQFQKGDLQDSHQTIAETLHVLDGLDSATKAQYAFLEAELLNLKGLYLMTNNDFDKAITAFEEARRINNKLSRVRQLGMNLYNIARVNSLMGNQKRALIFLEDALSEFKPIDYAEGLAATYDELIKTYEELNDTEMAYTYTQKRRDLKLKLEFEKYRVDSAKEKNLLHQKIQELIQMKMDLEQQIWSLKFELEALGSASKEHSISETVVKKQQEEISQYQLQVADLEAKIADYEKQIPDTSNIEKLQGEITDLKTQNYEQSKFISLLEEKLEEKDQEIHTLRQKIDELDGKSTEEMIETYKKQVQNLSKQLSDSAERTTELEDIIDQQQQEIDALEQSASTTTPPIIKQNAEADTELSIIPPAPVPLSPDEYEQMPDIESPAPDTTQSTVTEATTVETPPVIEEKTAEPSENAFKKKYIPQPKRVEPAQSQSGTEARVEQPVNKSDKRQESEDISIKSPTTVSLKSVLAEDPLAEMVHKLLQQELSINLRMLAMRVGVNPQSCRKTVENLAKTGTVKIQDGDNPIVHYIS